MSAESGEVPPGVRDLSDQAGPTPAQRDDRRGPGGGVPERVYYEDSIRLPGYREQPNRCSSLKPVGFCRDHGHVALGSSSCGTRRCPQHWDDWQDTATINMVARLAAYRHAADGAGKRMIHAFVSPPPDSRWWSSSAFWDARSETYDVAKEIGMRGAAVIPHPYRSNWEGDEFFQTAVEQGAWEREWGKWSLFRDASDTWGEMQQWIEPGPHYHMVAACEDFDPDAVPDGWTAQNIRSLDRFHIRDVESYRPMVGLAQYLLSHAAEAPDRQTVTYMGEVHPASFSPEEELTAAEWERIQQYAEAAVKTKPGESPLAGGSAIEEKDECRRDGCESEIVAIDELEDYLSDDEWCRSIERKELWTLRGVYGWAVLGDRPPPGTVTDQEKLIGWLHERGRASTLRVTGQGQSQVGLGEFLV